MSKITSEHFNRNLTRAEAVEILGETAVDRLECENCDYTSRVSADLDCNNEVEFSASISLPGDEEWDGLCLTAYYYQDKDAAREAEDLGSLNWVVSHFTLA
jgi:hypothetical protein